MPATMTLKNIPNDVYNRLRAAAKLHRRSLNSEAIVCLEAILIPDKVKPNERLARAREMRSRLPPGKFRTRGVRAFKDEGRP